ncbi:MAG: type II CAAX endopeptidase family protein [bacterium]
MRIIIAILFLSPATLWHVLVEQFLQPESQPPLSTVLTLLDPLVAFVLFLVAYHLYCRVIEKRPALEISSPGSLPELGVGFLIGAGMMAFMVGVISVPGYYRIESFNPDSWILVMNLPAVGIAAFAEELLFRLIVFKLSEELLGSWLAIMIQAVYFALAHMGNPDASVETTLLLLISAGVLLAAAYMYTRRVWLVLGIHVSWNYFQSTVFGLPTSGKPADGWIKPVIDGPVWLTGGEYGIEASYMATLLVLVVGIVILRKAIGRGQVVAPVWKRKRVIVASSGRD